MAVPTPVRIDLNNVQAIIVGGCIYPVCRHLLFRFETAAGAREFLFRLPMTTSAAHWFANKPDRVVNIAISYGGLEVFGVLSTDALARFSEEFRIGPVPERLGDVGPSARWWEGVPTASLHCLVSLFAASDSALAELTVQVLDAARITGTTHQLVRRGGQTIDGRMLTPLRRLHFGYQDGFSGPSVCWQDPAVSPELDFRHFLLGYATDEIQSSPRDLGRSGDREAVTFAADGSYAAFRLMYQDVAAFNRFLADNAARLAPQAKVSEQEMSDLLAAKMLGRWRDGQPLVLAPKSPGTAEMAESDFGYGADVKGEACPFSAHIRVVNPRDQKLDELQGAVPRVLRRGMPYGEELTGTVDDNKDRGLIGFFLCSSLGVQFQKLMDWINRNDFSPVFTDLRAQDPLLGNRDLPRASREFLIPTQAGPLRATGLSTFVRTLGTAYFMIPSLRALRQLSGQ